MPVRRQAVLAMTEHELPGCMVFDINGVDPKTGYTQEQFDKTMLTMDSLFGYMVEAVNWNRVREEALGWCLKDEHEHSDDVLHPDTMPCGASFKKALLNYGGYGWRPYEPHLFAED